MRITEEPFITRDLVLRARSPERVPTEARMRTLRDKQRASSHGLKVEVRLTSGRVGGSMVLYNPLVADAARAVGRDMPKVAQQLAAAARRLEHAKPAKLIYSVIERLAKQVPSDPTGRDAPSDLRRYIQARRCWATEEPSLLAREWLVRSSSWLDQADGDRELLVEAIQELSFEAEKVRSKLLTKGFDDVSTFFGYVRMLDRNRAAIEGENGELRVMRRVDLERHGLATVGQAVALLDEVSPTGGFSGIPMAAAMLEPPTFDEAPSPFDPGFAETGLRRIWHHGPRDSEWLRGAFVKEPSVVPVGSIPVTWP